MLNWGCLTWSRFPRIKIKNGPTGQGILRRIERLRKRRRCRKNYVLIPIGLHLDGAVEVWQKRWKINGYFGLKNL